MPGKFGLLLNFSLGSGLDLQCGDAHFADGNLILPVVAKYCAWDWSEEYKWENLCRDCDKGPNKQYIQVEDVTLSECQLKCDKDCWCSHILYGTGVNFKKCRVNTKDTKASQGNRSYEQSWDKNWDAYQRVKTAPHRELEWRVLCENCVFEHEWEYHPIEVNENSDVDSLESCQRMAQDASAAVAEYNESTKQCNFKWGGNHFSGTHYTKKSDPNTFNTYVLLDPKYVGCYRDRIRRRSAMKFVGYYRADGCAQKCKERGATHFGLQLESRCSCSTGNKYAKHGKWTPENRPYGLTQNSLDWYGGDLGCSPYLMKNRKNPYWKKIWLKIRKEKRIAGHKWFVRSAKINWNGAFIQAVFRI